MKMTALSRFGPRRQPSEAYAEGVGPLLPDQLRLLQRAMQTLEETRDVGQDLTQRLLAQADVDGNGMPWYAYVYSVDADGHDLRLVGHSERVQNDRRGGAGHPPGKRIGFMSPASPEAGSCVVRDLLEERALAACPQGDPSAEAVSEALGSFEDAPCDRAPAPFSLGELTSLLPSHGRGRLSSVKIISGVDAFLFGRGRPEFVTNSLFQVASQFNFLESTNTNHMPLRHYAWDRTQGPRASLGCPGMLALRNAAFKHVQDLELQPFFAPLRAAYSRGYFCPRLLAPGDIESALRHVSGGWRDLRVLAQTGTTLFGTETTQVFMAAPSFQGERAPSISEDVGRMCEIIVGRQYQALGVLAAKKAAETGRCVNLHVTLLGQGAFRNPPEVMETALALLLEAVGDADVVVYVHAWSPSDVEAASSVLSKVATLESPEIVPSKNFYRS